MAAFERKTKAARMVEIREAAKKIFKSSSFWFFGFTLFFVGGAEGAFSFWSATFIQVNLKLLVIIQ